jgi:hypothetical protein
MGWNNIMKQKQIKLKDLCIDYGSLYCCYQSVKHRNKLFAEMIVNRALSNMIKKVESETQT